MAWNLFQKMSIFTPHPVFSINQLAHIVIYIDLATNILVVVVVVLIN